jgi:4,5-dihydroxyphthalate decarboxylase
MPNGNNQMAIDRAATPALFPIHMAVADYDRTRPIMDGRIKADGVDLKVEARYIGDFCLEPVYEQFDVAEMSFSWYVTARSLGEPVVALPIFPLRMPVLAYVFVREDSAIDGIKNLAGKRIGVPSYRLTVNLWLRGIFKDYYGLAPSDVTWVTCQKAEGAGYEVPSGIRIEVAEGASAEKLLDQGKVDAILVPRIPQSFVEGKSNMRRLFRDAQGEFRQLTRRMGFVPLTHTIVMKQSLSERAPWLCESLTRAFMDAQRVCDAAYQSDPKFISMTDAVFHLEQNQATYGAHSWAHGVSRNRACLSTFLRHAHEQGYTARRLSVEELFPANTLGL